MGGWIFWISPQKSKKSIVRSEREREMERNEQIPENPVCTRNEMWLRDGWLVDLWERSGLVWSGVLLHTRVSYLTCLHGLNATNEVVMCFFQDARFESGRPTKKNNGNPKKI